MQLLLTEILNLPGIEVEDYTDVAGQLILAVEARATEAICPRCQQTSHHLHQNHWYLARDLSISGQSVFLKINRRQFKCQTCGKPFSETLNFIGNRRKQTDRFAQSIVQQVLHSDIHNVALVNDLTDDEVWSMVQYISKKKLNVDVSSLKRLGIDEIALRKGQGDYIVVLVDLERRVPLGFAPSRKQEDVRQVLEGWGAAVLGQIVEVSIDLSGNYKGLVHKLLPNATVVADRFHVMKIVNQDLDTALKTLCKANEQTVDEVEKARIAAALKQSKYALLKPEANLTQKQKVKLEEIREVLPDLAQMHQQKEAFRAIFEQAKDWGDGTFQLLDWLAQAQASFQESVGTICRWFGEVTAYFDNRTTSGVVEGINNKLKLIKRSGYGFRNFDNFQLRCLICWHLAID
ncbi:MAG: ISL3 family transposase [Leptolyngbyaceae cyanobacterium RU_5_1]|nr:ISL3 family transposase [Leptolyngbyaceae cyanobacterium RU_5_1]